MVVGRRKGLPFQLGGTDYEEGKIVDNSDKSTDGHFEINVGEGKASCLAHFYPFPENLLDSYHFQESLRMHRLTVT